MSTAESARPGLVRGLGVTAAASITVCNIIGQGIFLKTRAMTCNVGAPTLVIAAWIAAGCLATCAALTFAELGALMPESGGPYKYLRAAYGQLSSFCYGWMILFVAGPATIAALGAGAAIFFNALSGGALDQIHLVLPIPGFHFALSGSQLFSAFVIIAIAVVNCLPVNVNGWVATILTTAKILLVAGLTIAAFVLGHGTWAHFSANGLSGTCAGVDAATRGGASGFGAAMISALYAYNGWYALTYIAGEVKNPGRTIPTAIAWSMAIVVTLYAIVNVAYFFVLSPQAIANIAPTSSVGVEVVRSIFGATSGGVAAGIVLISVIATLHVVMLSYARVTFAFAGDGLGLKWLARASRWSHVPISAVITTAFLGVLVAFSGTFETLSNYLIFNEWVFFALTGTTIFLFRRRIPSEQRPYEVWGYPIVPMVFVGVAVWLLIQTAFTSPVQAFIGIAIVATGLPVYWLRSRNPAARARLL